MKSYTLKKISGTPVWEAIPAAEAKEKLPEMEDALFEHIKEQDKKQWKNSEQNQDIDYSQDY